MTEKATWYRKRPKKVDGEGMESDQRDRKKKRKRKPKDNKKKNSLEMDGELTERRKNKVKAVMSSHIHQRVNLQSS